LATFCQRIEFFIVIIFVAPLFNTEKRSRQVLLLPAVYNSQSNRKQIRLKTLNNTPPFPCICSIKGQN